MIKEEIGDVGYEIFVWHYLVKFPVERVRKCSMFERLFHDETIGIYFADLCT